jgi:excisionase family DNA binding protein
MSRINPIPEACKRLGCSKSTLYSEARRGKITIITFGGRSGVTDAEIERVIAEAEAEARNKRALKAA